MTPYEIHAAKGHKTTWYSPDGFQKVEECEDCGQRFLHDPIIGYPVTLRYRWMVKEPKER